MISYSLIPVMAIDIVQAAILTPIFCTLEMMKEARALSRSPLKTTIVAPSLVSCITGAYAA